MEAKNLIIGALSVIIGIILLIIGIMSWIVYIPIFSNFYIGESFGIIFIIAGVLYAKKGV